MWRRQATGNVTRDPSASRRRGPNRTQTVPVALTVGAETSTSVFQLGTPMREGARMTVTDTRSVLAAKSAREHLLRLDRLRLIGRAQGRRPHAAADRRPLRPFPDSGPPARRAPRPSTARGTRRNPEEVIYQRSAGSITDETMMDTLVNCPLHGRLRAHRRRPAKGRLRQGKPGRVRRAYRRGLLGDDEWDVLFDRTRNARSRVGVQDRVYWVSVHWQDWAWSRGCAETLDARRRQSSWWGGSFPRAEAGPPSTVRDLTRSP